MTKEKIYGSVSDLQKSPPEGHEYKGTEYQFVENYSNLHFYCSEENPIWHATNTAYEIQSFFTNDAARKEVMMSKLYRVLGFVTPPAQLIDLGNGMFGVAKYVGRLHELEYGDSIWQIGNASTTYKAGDGEEETKGTVLDSIRAQDKKHGVRREKATMLIHSVFNIVLDHEARSLQNWQGEEVYAKHWTSTREGTTTVQANIALRKLGCADIENNSLTKVQNGIKDLKFTQTSQEEIQNIDKVLDAIKNNARNNIRSIAKIIFEYGTGTLEERYNTYLNVLDCAGLGAEIHETYAKLHFSLAALKSAGKLQSYHKIHEHDGEYYVEFYSSKDTSEERAADVRAQIEEQGTQLFGIKSERQLYIADNLPAECINGSTKSAEEKCSYLYLDKEDVDNMFYNMQKNKVDHPGRNDPPLSLRWCLHMASRAIANTPSFLYNVACQVAHCVYAIVYSTALILGIAIKEATMSIVSACCTSQQQEHGNQRN